MRDKSGKPYTVRNEAVNAMLLNEFLKEHSTVEKLQSMVAELTPPTRGAGFKNAKNERSARNEQTRSSSRGESVTIVFRAAL